ncbi:MAG: flavodoxin [Acidimicrobiales bacterium]
MRALVVYESMFGNTQAVAEAVADGLALADGMDGVGLVEVGVAPAHVDDDVDLLVVGAPTHAFSLSRPATRQDAVTKSGETLVSSGTGLREWLAGLDRGSHRPASAAFDTKVAKPRLPGSAARAAAKRLRRLGMAVVVPPATFLVDGMTGPLLDGEVDRARRWGTDLGARVARSAIARG